jgi:exodeoxyribonuclease-1
MRPALGQLDLDLAALRHAQHAAALGGTLDALWPPVFARARPPAAPDVDEDLYGGFVGNEDRRTLQRLRELQPGQLATKHPAFRTGGWKNCCSATARATSTDTLTDEEQARWQQHRAARLHDGAGGHR